MKTINHQQETLQQKLLTGRKLSGQRLSSLRRTLMIKACYLAVYSMFVILPPVTLTNQIMMVQVVN